MESNFQFEEKIANVMASMSLNQAIIAQSPNIQRRIAYSFEALSEFRNSIRHFSEESYAKRAIRKAEFIWRKLALEANSINLQPSRERPYIELESCQIHNTNERVNPCSPPQIPFVGCFEDMQSFSNPSMIDFDGSLEDLLI